jgi:uncharacterized protein
MRERRISEGWSEDDIQALEDFLFGTLDDGEADNGLDSPMCASEIDGFFCALISGPRMVSPLVALRWVFDSESGEQQPPAEGPEQMQWLMNLLMKQWNATATALLAGPGVYQPLLGWRELEGRGELPVIDEWCWGYCKGMELTQELWQPLVTEHPEWFETLLLYGTEAGWERLQVQQPADAEHRDAAAELDLQAWQIHNYWLQRRGESSPPLLAAAAQPQRRSGPKPGRNEPCPCGSGRKYKHCHGAN